MQRATLIRWSGLAAMLGGVLWAGLELVGMSAWTEPVFGLTYEDYNRMKSVPLLLLFLGLLGFYARQEGHSGKLGRAGFLMGAVGLGLMLAGNVVEFWIGGGIRYGDKAVSTLGWNLVLIGAAATVVGLILFGIASLRASVLARWRKAAPLLIALMPAAAIGLTMGVRMLVREEAGRRLVGDMGMAASIILFGLGWILLGHTLWLRK